jgi:hypothetical protein
MGLRKSELIPLQVDKKPKSEENQNFETEKISSFDEYFGLNDWSMFHLRNLRPSNFNYCKVYHKIQKIMINTSHNIMGLLYSTNSNNFFSSVLYQNEQPQIIEDFVCNLGLSQYNDSISLVIKHLNQDYLRLYDCSSKKIIRKIKLDNKNSNNFINSFNDLNLENENSQKMINTKPQMWKRFEKRNTLLSIKLGLLNSSTLAISEREKESWTEGFSSGKSSGAMSNVTKHPLPGEPLTQYLEHNQNNIFHLNNHFLFSIFDERQMKNSFRKCLFETDFRGIWFILFFNKSLNIVFLN